jgi:hypothetical protein
MARWLAVCGRAILVLACVFFVVRAVAEFWVVDFNDVSSYRSDWGGPSLVGVLAVHCIPGVASVLVLWHLGTRRGRSLPES